MAVTGAAWTTPLGDDLDEVWRRLCAGETGIVPVPHAGKLRNELAAVVPSARLSSTASQRMTALALPPLRRALGQAGCDPAGDDVQLVLGTSLGAFLEGEPGSAPLHAWADALGEAVGAARPPIALSTACSSGSDAVLVGAELIRAGAARRVVCGGVDVLTLAKRLAHSALGSMSPTMLRAFDVRHDGTLLGEGAGFMVLEAAGARRPFATLRGVGSANDAAGMTAPDTAALGARYALVRSIEDADLPPEAIGVVNAHGSGTPLNDVTEAKAFDAVLGAARALPVVFATKGNFGHSLGATGILEAIAVVMALRTGEAPPIVGLTQPCPEMRFPLPRGAPIRHDARFGLSLTLGFGGFDTSLIFEAAR